MFEFSESQILAWIAQFIWPLFRLTAFFMTAPILGANYTPARIRLSLALAVTMIVAPVLPSPPAVDFLSMQALLITLNELLIGFALGFIMQIFFEVFIVGGQILAMNMGLGFANMNDPGNGVTVAAVSQVFVILVTLTFVLTGGIEMLLTVLSESFFSMPIGSFIPLDNFTLLFSWGSWIFSSGLLMALPAVTALLVVNISFGMMTRAAPQLNVFALGFPVAVIMGLYILYLMVGDFMPLYQKIAQVNMEHMWRFIQL